MSAYHAEKMEKERAEKMAAFAKARKQAADQETVVDARSSNRNLSTTMANDFNTDDFKAATVAID